MSHKPIKLKVLKTLVTFIFVSITGICNAQYFSWGNDPSNIKWKQINTENFQIIFPEGSDSVAQHFCNMLNYAYKECAYTLKHQPKKISVVMHTKSSIANGSVAWAPKRMDIFDVVSQNQISTGWFEELVIHEYRHVVQMDKLNQGLTRILYFLLGEQAVGAVVGLYLPSWYLEGDAVCTETGLSNSGRGRQADFSMGLRAQLMEKKKYAYAKAYFGSYKNYVPNHYEMGYVVVANARNTYGTQLWEEVEYRVARKPLSITPFNKSIKLQTELNKRKLYHEMFDKQQIEWKLMYEREIQKPFDTLTKRTPKEYTNYIHPYRISENQVIAERYGIGNISQLVLCKQGEKDRVLANISFKESEERFHTNGNLIVWAENHPDIRWELQGTSDIYVYSISTKRIDKIETNKRVYSPCITKVGDKIATVEIDEKSRYLITIFNTADKQIITQISAPNNEFIHAPSWNADGTKLVLVTISSKGKRILELDVATRQFTEIIPYTFDDLLNPIYWDDFILYSSSYSGVDNLYAINIKTKDISRITVSGFGAKYPSVYYNKLLFSDYTSDGYMIGQFDLAPHTWHTIEAVRKEKNILAQTLTIQEDGIVDFSKMNDTTFVVKPYSKVLHAINIHSWMPFYIEYNGNEVSDQGLGFQLISQDKLGTTISSVGYKESSGSSRKAGFAKVTYSGLFPVINFEYSNGTQTYTDIFGVDTVEALYHITSINSSITLPLNFSSRSYYRYLNFSLQGVYESYDKLSVDNRLYDTNFKTNFDVGIVLYTANFMNILESSRRDLKPRFGQIVNVGFLHAPFQTSEIYEDHIFASSKLYFPGIFKHDGLDIYGGYEWNVDTANYTYQGGIQMPRGYANEVFNRKEMISLRANYSFPMMYPDLYCGAMLFVKRIRGNIFVDYARTTHVFDANSIVSTGDKEMLSFGAEVLFDFHMFHMPAPISWGGRLSIMPEKQTMFIETIFSVNFSEL